MVLFAIQMLVDEIKSRSEVLSKFTYGRHALLHLSKSMAKGGNNNNSNGGGERGGNDHRKGGQKGNNRRKK